MNNVYNVMDVLHIIVGKVVIKYSFDSAERVNRSIGQGHNQTYL